MAVAEESDHILVARRDSRRRVVCQRHQLRRVVVAHHLIRKMHSIRNALAVEWLHYDRTDPALSDAASKLAAAIRQKHVPVRNHDGFEPGDVVAEVGPQIAPQRLRVRKHAVLAALSGTPTVGS